MEKYQIRKLIKGEKVNPVYKGKTLVAVPEYKLQQDAGTIITHEDKSYIINPNNYICSREFPDKFKPNQTYKLFYYEWMGPVKQKSNQTKLF
jgi:hypothetical protein